PGRAGNLAGEHRLDPVELAPLVVEVGQDQQRGARPEQEQAAEAAGDDVRQLLGDVGRVAHPEGPEDQQAGPPGAEPEPDGALPPRRAPPPRGAPRRPGMRSLPAAARRHPPRPARGAADAPPAPAGEAVVRFTAPAPPLPAGTLSAGGPTAGRPGAAAPKRM